MREEQTAVVGTQVERLQQSLKWFIEERDYFERVSNQHYDKWRDAEKMVVQLTKVIERCLIGGNSLASLIIGFDLPSGHGDWTYEEASKYFYENHPLDPDVAYQRYEIWLCWKTLHDVSREIDVFKGLPKAVDSTAHAQADEEVFGTPYLPFEPSKDELED